MPYQYTPLKSKLFVSIAEYNKAYKLAELEEPYTDPRPLLAIIARFMEVNNRVSGLVRAAHDAILGFPWDVVPSDSTNERAVDIARQIKDRIVQSHLHHHFDVIIDGEFYGLTALRQIWQAQNNIWIPILDIIPTTELYHKRNKDGIYTYAFILDDPKFVTRSLSDEENAKYIFSYFNPYKATRPNYFGGLIRSAIPLTIIKNFSWQDWSQFVELFAQPFRTAAYSDGATEGDKAAARKALEEFGRNSWALFSDRIKFEIHEAATNGNSASAYERILDKIDAELAILINGEANTQELPNSGGSRAAVQTLKLVSDDRMWQRILRLENIINEQYIAVDYKLNISAEDTSLCPKFKILTDEKEDYETNARIINELKSAGVPLLKSEVYAKTGFTAPQDGDEIL
ncbi:MAG: DUF935 family protein [Bacteroidetes bacterium]|nr:DUF935 family protein [Bacteroidota bacterium]